MKKVVAALAIVSASMALVACGGGGDNGTTTGGGTGGAAQEGAAGGGGAGGGQAGGAETLKFEADPGGGLAYTATKATGTAGKATIEIDNPQPLPHDVAIEDESGATIGKTDTVAEGSASATVDLKPGTYTFYCSVPGHREAGMEGTLTVK